MNEEKGTQFPEDVMATVEKLDGIIEDVMNQVRAKERECLMTIYGRFCLKKALPLDPSKIDAVPAGKNQTNYWYKFGTKEEFFLMTATFNVIDNTPNLKVDFNHELAFNNEL